MQLKIKRSQREGGATGTAIIFCLDARVQFTQQEAESILRYHLQNQVIYNSEASKQHLARAEAQRDGTWGGNLKSLASVAMAAMRLNITIAGLERGQHIECKSMDELIGAEDAIMIACGNLKGYIEKASTFDGQEFLVDFDSEGPKMIAHSVSPAPILALAPLPDRALAAEPAPSDWGPPMLSAPPTPPVARPETFMDIPDSELPDEDDGYQPGMSDNQKLALIVGGIVLVIAILYFFTKGH